MVFVFNSANCSAKSTLDNDDKIGIEKLKNLAKNKCSKNPDYKMRIWKCLETPGFDNDCIRIAQECTTIDTDFTDTNADHSNVNLTSIVENVVSGLEDWERNSIKKSTGVVFSTQENHPEFRTEILARCLDQGAEKQWIMEGSQEDYDEFCNDVKISPARYIKEPRYMGKCKPSWLSLHMRTEFYMKCLQNYNFDGLDGLLSRVQYDVRSLNEIATAMQKKKRESAETSIATGASKVAGGILTGIGISLAPFTAGGSMLLTGIGSAIVTGSSITSFVKSLGGNNEKLITDATKNAKKIKEDVAFLEELMTLHIHNNEALPALDFNQEMMRKNLENKVKESHGSSITFTLSAAMIVDTIINAVILKNTAKAVEIAAADIELTNTMAKSKNLYHMLKNSLASGPPVLTRIAKSEFGKRASKFFKLAKKTSSIVFKIAVPIVETAFGAWEILEGKEKMKPGGIHNQILLQSRQIKHRIANLAAAYTHIVGTQINVNDISEEVYEIDVYSQTTKGVYISLEIESAGNKCRTKEFKTGSQGHVYVYSSDILDKCDRHQIKNKTATIRLISESTYPVQIDKVDIRTNGKLVPLISCTKKNANGTSIPLKVTKEGYISEHFLECKREMALQKVKTHTTHISNSGTDANLDMTFRVTEKVGNGNGIIRRRCESLRLNARCSSKYNCHEYGDIEEYHVSDLATCDDLMEELAEGLWDSEKYELEVEMYNDGSNSAPDWSIDMLKLYFMAESEAKIVTCYGGPDQGDAGDVWIKAKTTTILKCQQYQPNKPEISLEAINAHVCDLTYSGSSTDQLIFRFCEKEADLQEIPADIMNNPKCCVTNRMGYYNMDDEPDDEFVRNKWKMLDGNTKTDDGGDKLGQCEGFAITGPKIFVSVENQRSDAVCIDQLKFYGTPKLAIAGTSFASCDLPAHTWAESSMVYKYSRGTNQYVAKKRGQQVSNVYHHKLAISECYIGKGNTLKSLDLKVCEDGVDVGSESEFAVVIENGNNKNCTMTIKEHLHKNTFNMIEDISVEGGCGTGNYAGTYYDGLDLGNEVKMWILNADQNDMSDALCLTHAYLSISNAKGITNSLQCRYNERADFAVYFQGSKKNGLPLICSVK
jgi:hypothetical protein